MSEEGGVDLSGLHRELDGLKKRLCRCNFQGECIACKGFEVLREQSQMVIAAASQPVLMQVAQEAAIQDLMGQMGGLQEKLGEDPRLQELMLQVMERVQEDLGGPEEMLRLMKSMGFDPGTGGPLQPGPRAPEDRPGGMGFKPRPQNPDAPGGGDGRGGAGDNPPA